MKTIKQIADDLGVSKQAVSKRLSQLPPTEVTTNEHGIKLITPCGEKILKDSISPTKTQLPPTTTNQIDTLVSMLQKELDAKNDQLTAKDKQIEQLTAALEHTTASLQAAQALHAGTLQNQQLIADETIEEKPQSLFARIFKKNK